jgi:ribosomal protein L11 methyltransferase
VIRLALRVPREQSELVLAELLELAPAGVEESEIDSRTVEYAVYGAPGELPGLPDLKALVAGSLIEISTSELADDWQERWKQFHKPVTIPAATGTAQGLRVRPPWEPAEEQPSGPVQEIVIDPGQAFGTGSHATTKLCLSLLLELAATHTPGAVLDVGAGSGVLAIAAGKLGYAPLLALDNEHESVSAAGENAARNGVELQCEHFDLRSDPLPWLGGAGVPPPSTEITLLANLLRPLLLELSERIANPPSHLIAGGMLAGELDEIASAYLVRHGMHEIERRIEGEWGALLLGREANSATST